jgi:D-psicose/D-tagatose/L-ribulose 3-epimerase
MKVAMHNWMRAEPVETTIRRLAKYGYDGIEISYDSVELSPGASGTAAIRDTLVENGIECVGSISLMFAGRDLIHADPAVRPRSAR